MIFRARQFGFCMKKTFPIILAAVVVVIALFTISCNSRSRQPVYDGKPLSAWIADLNYEKPDAVRAQAQKAIRQIGTDSLPFLIKEMRTLGNLWGKMGATNFDNSDGLTDRNVNLREAFATLGPIAKPAIPELVYLLNSATNYANDIAAYALTQIDPQFAVVALTQALTNKYIGARCSAANELYEVRSNAAVAVPNLILCLKDDDSQLRDMSADALGFVRSRHEIAIPALIEALRQDKDFTTRIFAARALGEFGERNDLVISALVQASTNDLNSHVRLAATNALKTLKAESQ
jgi:HEAT repeat protein